MAVYFQRTSYTISSQYNNSVEICVKSTSKGTAEEFVIIAETDSTISEVLTICISNEIMIYADSTYLSQSSSKLHFVVDSENITATQCYNILADFQAEGICDLFGESCDPVHLQAHLSNNESDPVSITGDSAQVVVEVPDRCKCSSSSLSSNIDNIVITASVLSVAVAIAIVGVIVVIIFFCRKTKTLATTKIIEE